MADQLYLSYWLRGFTERNMLRHFEKLLGKFPFSTIAPKPLVFRVYALEYAEPALLERLFEPGAEPGSIVESARELRNADYAYLVEGQWDIWRYEDGWKLVPSRATLACFGPLFDNDLGDQLRVEVGLDADFLPQPERPDSVSKVQSNIRGLLRLAHELDDALPVDQRRLWSESGENFADRLQAEFR